MAIKLLDIIRRAEPHGLTPGAALNHIAPRFGPPDGWTFPWTDPFGGSIEYGDLRLGVIARNRNVLISDFSIALWETHVSEDGETHRAPKAKPRLRRHARIDLQGISGGMSTDDVGSWFRRHGLGFSEFEQPSLASEEGRQIVANGNTLFSFCRGGGSPWLMDVVVFDKSHPLWPVRNGVGAVRRMRSTTLSP